MENEFDYSSIALVQLFFNCLILDEGYTNILS